MKRPYLLLLIPFIFFLTSCGKKKDPGDDKSFIERITSEDVSCYRVMTSGIFGYSPNNWRCTEIKPYLTKD